MWKLAKDGSGEAFLSLIIEAVRAFLQCNSEILATPLDSVSVRGLAYRIKLTLNHS